MNFVVAGEMTRHLSGNRTLRSEIMSLVDNHWQETKTGVIGESVRAARGGLLLNRGSHSPSSELMHVAIACAHITVKRQA